MRARLVLSLAAVAILIGPLAGAADEVADPAPKPVRIETVVPADAVLYFELSDITRSKKRLKACPLGRISSEDEVTTLLAEPLLKLNEVLNAGQAQMGIDFLGMAKSLKGQVGFALLGMKDVERKVPDLAIIIEADGDGRAEIETIISGLLGRLREQAPDLAVQEYQYGPARVKVLAIGEAEIAWCIAEGLAIGTLGRATVEKLLDNMGDKKGNVLADDQAFKTVKKIVGKDADLLLYASPSRFIKKFKATIRQRDLEDLTKSGLVEIPGAAYAVTVAADGFHEAAFAYMPEKKGVLKLFDQTSLELKGLKAVPRTAVAVLAARLDAKKTLNTFFEIVAEFEGPDQIAKARADIAKMEQDLGINLETQLYEALTGEIQAYVSFPPGGGAIPDGVLMAEVAKVDDFRVMYDVIMAILKQQAAPAGGGMAEANDNLGTFPFGDHTVTYFKIGPESPVTPTFCLTDDYLFLASNPAAMKRGLRWLKSDKGIDQVETFTSAIKPLSGRKSGLFYVDTAALFNFGYNTALPFVQNMKKDPKTGFDPNLLPLADTIAQHLSGWAISLGTTGEGVLLQSSGPFPIVPGILGVGAAAGARRHRRHRGRRMGRAEPVVPPGEGDLPEGEGGEIF